MKVFKFGGASVKDAQSVRNVLTILNKYPGEQLFVVISAMGKNTNALEEIVREYFSGADATPLLEKFKETQRSMVHELIPVGSENHILPVVEALFSQLDAVIASGASFKEFDAFYDAVVPFGELLSTHIIHEYLQYNGLESCIIPAFDWVKTDSYYRFAKVDIEASSTRLRQLVAENNGKSIYITQGFIGAAADGSTTTLGREGSDYTAALAGSILQAESVTVWKDVPGLLNADPRRMENLTKIDRLSYHEAIELAYYGAKVIHPKTIKPIENSSIPLFIRSFLQPDTEGTLIHHTCENDTSIPFFIFHENQILISISVKDLSFVTEESLHHIFGILSRCRLHVHLMQISAVSFSICIDYDKMRCEQFLHELGENYHIRYNKGLELITIRHYHNVDEEAFLAGKEVLLEQRSRATAQFVVR